MHPPATLIKYTFQQCTALISPASKSTHHIPRATYQSKHRVGTQRREEGSLAKPDHPIEGVQDDGCVIIPPAQRAHSHVILFVHPSVCIWRILDSQQSMTKVNKHSNPK